MWHSAGRYVTVKHGGADIWRPLGTPSANPSKFLLKFESHRPISPIWLQTWIRDSARDRFYTVVDLVNRLEAEGRTGRYGRLVDQLCRMAFWAPIRGSGPTAAGIITKREQRCCRSMPRS